MGIFYNNYQKLVSENNLELARLSESNWDILGRMMKYMESFSISRFELEVIKKDLIGMAGEAQLEESTLLDRIGMPEKEFCDRLVENAAKRSLLERMIPIMRNVLFLTFGFYTLEWLMEGIPADFGITNRVLLIAGVLAAVDLFDIRARGRIVYLGKWKRNLIKGIIMLAWFVVLNTCIISGPTSLFPGIIPENFLIMGKGTAVFAVLLILALALFFWNNYFWDRCSRRYQWE